MIDLTFALALVTQVSIMIELHKTALAAKEATATDKKKIEGKKEGEKSGKKGEKKGDAKKGAAAKGKGKPAEKKDKDT